MKIREILSHIADLAKTNGISEPYIVGGIPRDKILGTLEKAEDIDITTGDESIHKLAQLVSNYFRAKLLVMPDNHSQIRLGNVQIDFSSNYRSAGIGRMLEKVGAESGDMMQELMSRDFTCNILLMSMDTKTIKDPTGLGINDIKRKLLRTPLPPYITLGMNHKRVVRVFYLAAKLGFEVEPAIIKWIKVHPDAIMKGAKQQYVAEKLQKAMQYDADKTVKLLDEMGLWQSIPITEELMPYATKYGRM